jgi:pimeloyl-ACP methyl ester carboxylesterase
MIARHVTSWMTWLLSLLTFAAVGAALVAFVAVKIAQSLLRPPRMTDGRAMYFLRRLSPGDLGLPFETMKFTVRDESRGQRSRDVRATIDLAAWWMPNANANGRCAVLLHGYADAKVGAIAWAPLFHQLGFNVVALDLRAHGESGGRHSTGGCFERHDVKQVIEQLAVARPNDAKQVILFGASLGAAVALATAELIERDGAPDDGRLVGLVLDSPFRDYARAAEAQVELLGAPTTFAMPLAVRIAHLISGARFDELDAARMIRDLRVPIFMIESGQDVLVGEHDLRALAEAMQSRSHRSPRDMTWRVEGAPHLLALSREPEEYRRRLAQFVDARTVAW